VAGAELDGAPAAALLADDEDAALPHPASRTAAATPRKINRVVCMFTEHIATISVSTKDDLRRQTI
jgi:hypothetical protein